jgi:hypothetical protein
MPFFTSSDSRLHHRACEVDQPVAGCVFLPDFVPKAA